MGHAGGGVALERRRLAAAQRADDPGEQHRQRVAAGVDHAGLAQHRQQVGAALDRLLAGLQRLLDHLGDHRVLLLGGRRRDPGGVRHVGELGGHPDGHLAHHGEDRALGRIAHRAVGLVGGAGQRGADQHRIDQLARTAGQLLGRAADQLGEDHAGVAARAEQRRAGDRGDDLVATDVVDRALLGGAGEAIELLQHGPQRQHHVVAGVAVGDGEHVQVVDLLPARLERRQARPRRSRGSGRCWDRSPGRRHAARGASRPSAGLGDLAGLQAPRAHIHPPRRAARRRSGRAGGWARSAAWWPPSSGCGCGRRRDPWRRRGRPLASRRV